MSTHPAIISTGSPRGVPKPSTKVPSLNSTSWASATDTTKKFVLYRDGNACWFCARPRGLNVAHVLPVCDRHTFQRYQRMGLLAVSTTHLAHEENLITLCSACHEMFDNCRPIISILPTDEIIQEVYAYELANYTSREEAALNGIHQRRNVVHISPLASRGAAYLLSDDVHEDFGDRFYRMGQVRPLKAHPLPLILRFATGGIGPVVTTEITVSDGRTMVLGLPATTRSLIASFFSAWSRPDPSVVSQALPPSVQVSVSVPQEPNDESYSNPHGSRTSGAVDQTMEKADQIMADHSVDESPEPEAQPESSPSLTMHSDSTYPDEPFLFGPSLSTAGIVEFFLTSGFKTRKVVEGERAKPEWLEQLVDSEEGDNAEVGAEVNGRSGKGQVAGEGLETRADGS